MTKIIKIEIAKVLAKEVDIASEIIKETLDNLSDKGFTEENLTFAKEYVTKIISSIDERRNGEEGEKISDFNIEDCDICSVCGKVLIVDMDDLYGDFIRDEAPLCDSCSSFNDELDGYVSINEGDKIFFEGNDDINAFVGTLVSYKRDTNDSIIATIEDMDGNYFDVDVSKISLLKEDLEKDDLDKALCKDESGYAYYSNNEYNFKLFKTFEDGVMWLDSKDDTLVIGEFDNKKDLEDILNGIKGLEIENRSEVKQFTREEIRKLLLEGKRITCDEWDEDSFIEFDFNVMRVIDEDGDAIDFSTIYEESFSSMKIVFDEE